MNTTNPNQPVNPDTGNGMPREVAIALLTAPKARLTNTVRKRCKAALLRIFVSPVPLLRGKGDTKFFAGVGCTEHQAEFNSKQKLGDKTLRQLLRWMRRCVRQRADCQAQYLKLQDAPEGETSRNKALRLRQCAILESIVVGIELNRDALDDEYNRRIARVRAKEEADSNPLAAFGL